MLFSSISFLYYFLPTVLGLYYIVPKQFKNFVLLFFSMLFYFYGEPVYSLLMIVSIVSGYLHGLWIDKVRSGKYAMIPMISSVIVSIGLLAYFKYFDFFIDNINSIFSASISPLKLALPIGISFYTFQILSYTIDVYRGETKVQKNILNFATYVALFPQLIAGPIVRYTTVAEELSTRTHSFENFSYGITRFMIGISKKVLLANTLGEISAIFHNANEKTLLFYWILALAFTLQIYFDFSGYSDMAIGLGRMFGFHFLENFHYPYIAKSISEFWRRWHMSLGTWFRDYVYIPMGGNRVPKLKWIRNIIVVWFLTGFWHGAQWNFILWGLYFAVFLMLEKYMLNRILDRLPFIVRHIYVLFFIVLSFVIFNANGIGEVMNNLKGMFGFLQIPLYNLETLYYLKSFSFVFIIAGIGATPLMVVLYRKLMSNKHSRYIMDVGQPIVIIILLLLITGYLVDGSFNPFLYFRF
ncbi:MAG: putative rane protein [Herbinix sp.]|jgi:alginate O-acetyltransferase complex protein AlgI|nr:putative rane protein [Herbinix sp.]